MKIDVLVAEIGSTTTVVNGFDGVESPTPIFVGQGQAPTSVLAGDVCVGLRGAIADLCRKRGLPSLEYGLMLATSSAAGGLRMSVHGLVYDMTVKAAREAALGAGANLHLTTAGLLEPEDLEEIRKVSPNLILLAGGTDYGERETVVRNARRIRELNMDVPVIYAGNIQNQGKIRQIFADAPAECYLVENVYPRLDELHVEPSRRVIQQVFETHIVRAPGMEQVRSMVQGAIIPTPGAVMECAQLLYEEVGDLVVLDVGGATTDVHSVTEGSEEIASIQITPEPFAKRTVEGDLGVYINAKSMAEQMGIQRLSKELGMDVTTLFADYLAIPETEEQFRLTECLTWHAASQALERHCGRYRHTYGSGGRSTYAEGKDLTKVQILVATGGALTRLPGRRAIMERLCAINEQRKLLFPQAAQLALLEDRNYLMASLGVLSLQHKEAAQRLLRQNLGL